MKTNKKQKLYTPYILALVLAAVLLGQGWLMTHATAKDWKEGASVLDVSSGVSQMISDLKFAFEPAVQTAGAINEFYNQSAIAATQLFDLSDSGVDPLAFVKGVNEFYNQASDQLAQVLDLSNYFTAGQPAVAGASIAR